MNAKEFFDQSPIGICVVKRDRKDMRPLYFNAGGKAIAAGWDEPDCETLIKQLKSPTPLRDITLKTGNRWITLTITEGEFESEHAFILWVIDISESKEAEQRLQQAVAQADAAAEVKANFLATMSHEIRTPMQSVYGLLELIGEEDVDARIESMVDTAKTSASGLLEILDDILDLAKMDAEKMELDMFEVPVRTLVRGILEAMTVKVQGKDVALLDDIGEDVPFVIIGDPKRLRQIIMNLMGNALKFTAEGSVTVHVSTETKEIPSPKKGVGLRFEVSDTGIGMTEDVCQKLFQPFTQADNSTSRKFGGTGLGLSICKKLVGLMGGKIGVTSIEGHGSTFWFEIPTEEVSTEDSTIELPKLDGVSVLSVEDHPQGAKEIVRSLESMGATVESCPTYAEGLDLVKRRPFDVGVIDQGLPDGLGLDLIRDIMAIRPAMGLVMYTVRDDIGLQHSLQSLGATYLSKPASRVGLGEAVQDAASKAARMIINGPKRLLIAEDTESVRDVLCRQLDKLGVEADFVEDGKKALDAVQTGKYGILLTDLHMPELDGYELVAAIRESEKTDEHMPVIVLTADVQMTQRQTYLSHGFDECMLKPVSLGQFRRLLIRWGLLEEEGRPQDKEPSPKNIDSLAAVDTAKMAEQMGAFDDSAIEMLHMFVEMTAPLLTRLDEALANDDIHDITEAAHSLKGAARSACCNVLGDVCEKLQSAAEDQKPCGDLIEQAKAEFERAREEIRTLKVS